MPQNAHRFLVHRYQPYNHPCNRKRLCRLLASCLLIGCAWVATAQADTQRYSVPGLSKEAEIVVDNYGVPHIYAQTHYDAFFVQGFNAARDRLWQIDTWRRRGLGKLSEVFGETYVAQDRAARMFLYRGDMYAEWLAYGSDAKRIAQAFTAGINAWLTVLDDNPEFRPPEFDLLDYAPARWNADDIVRIRSHGLWRNVAREVERAKAYCAGQPELSDLTKVLEPDWTVEVPEGLDPCSIPENVLDDYMLATAPVDFAAVTQAATKTSVSETAAIAATIAAGEDKALRSDLGSNNWAIAPEKTTTGRPILADDPHRAHAVPSLRYIAHLKAPGLDVIGAGEPALPGLSIGHNKKIAFGLTIFPIDHEDLYVYELAEDPLTIEPPEPAEEVAEETTEETQTDTEASATAAEPEAGAEEENVADAKPERIPNYTGYIYQGHYEPFTVVTDSIEIKGKPAREVSMRFTRHGPVLLSDTDSGKAFAIRAAWLQAGMAPYFGSVEYMRAESWREFVAALNRWGAPSENQVFADTEGNIGYKPAGLFPKRVNFDGLLPVPGDGRYEWQGFWDMDVLPEEFNPDRNWVGTANAMSLPDDYDIDTYRVGFEWSAPWRAKRLAEVLSQPGKFRPQSSLSLQRDYTSVLAKEVLKKLPKVLARESNEPHAQPLRYLHRWEGRLNPSSGPAALYAIWFYRHLSPQLAAHLSKGALTTMDSLAVVEKMSAAPDIVNASLASAWQDAVALMGDDPTKWTWGSLHKIQFTHPLLDLMKADGGDAKLAKSAELRPYSRGGSGNTTNNTYFSSDDFLVKSGASFRMVLDVGNWDDAWMTNAPGQSGDPRSPFYANLLDGWARERSFPLLYSRYRIERDAAMRIKLSPAQN